MLLKTFDLANHIKEYNRIKGTHHLDDTSFECFYFKKEILSEINTKINNINEFYDLFLFDTQDSQYIKGQQNALRDSKELLNDSIAKKASLSDVSKKMHCIVDDMNIFQSSINKKITWRNWLLAQSNTRYDYELAQWQNKVPKPDNFDKFKNEVKAKLLIARFNDRGVYFIAKMSLPDLSTYSKKAKKYLSSKHHQIPKEIKDKYQKYLDDLCQDIKHLQKMIIESMVERLEAYDESRGSYTNPLFSKAKKLNPALNEPRQPYNITSDEFTFFHEYIEKHGSFEDKKRLHKCSWFISSSDLQTKIIKTQDNGYIIAPEHLVSFVPIKKRWPQWLFSDVNLRQDIFKQSTLLFANLKFQYHKPAPFIDIYDPKSCLDPIEDIKQSESLICDSLDKLSKPPFNKVSWYSFGTKALCRKWKKILEVQQLKIIERKFDLAERYINCLNSSVVSSLNIPWETYTILLTLSQELEQLVKDNRVNTSFQNKFLSINTTLTKYASEFKFIDGLNKMAKGEVLEDDKLDYLNRYIDSRVISEPTFFESFKKYCEPQIISIKEQLYKQLKIDPFSLKTTAELQKHQKLITNLCNILEKTETLEKNEKFDKQIKKYFLKYLQHLLCNNNIHSDNHANTGKAIISILGKNITYLEKSLMDHIENLCSQKLDNPILFKINCKTLIITLGSKFLEQRFNKEIKQFDNELLKFIKEKNNDLNDDVIISLVKKIRCQLVNGTSIESLNITPAEQIVFSGITLNTSTNILTLVQCSAKAHQVKETFEKETTINNKTETVRILSQSISKCLSQNPHIPQVMQNKKWFEKQYIDEIVLSYNPIEISIKP